MLVFKTGFFYVLFFIVFSLWARWAGHEQQQQAAP